SQSSSYTGSSQEISTGASFSAQTETSQSSGSTTINTATIGSSAPVTFSSQSSLYTGASQESGTGASLPTQTETSQSSGSTAVNTATVPPTSAVTFSTPSVTYASVSQESSSGMSFSSQTGTSQFVTSGSEGSSGIIASVTQTPSSSAIPGSSVTGTMYSGVSGSTSVLSSSSSLETQTTEITLLSSLHTGNNSENSSDIRLLCLSTAASTGSVSTPTTIFTESTTVATSTGIFTSSSSTILSSSAIENVTVVSSISTPTVEVTTQVTLTSSASSSSVVTTTAISQTVTSIRTGTSVTSTTATSFVTSETSANTSSTTSTTASTSTTPAAENLIFTVLSTQSFDPNNSTLVETLRRGLSAVINFGFLCFNNPFNQECSQLSRRKRQTNQNYLIEIIPPVTLLSDANTYPKTYRVYYTVTDLSTNKSVSAAAVQSATDKLTNTQKVTLLGFIFEGNLIQSPNISHTVSTPTTDSKLWIIGAVLGPIAFVLLLIILFCFIYARCRKQGNNQSTAEAVYNIPQISSRASNYQTASNELRQEQATPLNNVRVLTQNDILLGNTASSKQLPPIKSQTASNNMPQYPVSVDIPMQETRHLNDVEHWRNKLRLQEKFEQHYADPLNDLDQVYHSSVPRTTTPLTNRSRTYQYNNPVFESDAPQTSENEVGRARLHHLLDEVLDQAEPPNQPYATDSVNEQQRQRRQRRRIHSTSYDPRNTRIINDNEQIYHTPIMPRVSERPDSNLLRLHYDPYEAGDRIHDIEHSMPVVFKPKYPSDDNDIRKYYSTSSFRSNQPLFYDDSTLNNRDRITTMDPYGSQNRQARTRIETDREFMMRPNRDHIGQRQHKFDNDVVYIDTMPKHRDDTRVPIHDAWTESNDNTNDQLFHLNPSDLNKRHDYRDEYMLAKQSVVNTKNLVSAIHDDLQQIVFDQSSDSHYV
ncbi:unnamed protein product, partial [Rotaria sp. Silwood2]